ncbi:MAG: Extracellular serine protease [Syntrophus sp. SKADARSKE-3]|nr:Extracellular serine protease [Syntrophus sp. SKADARSKE-3]
MGSFVSPSSNHGTPVGFSPFADRVSDATANLVAALSSTTTEEFGFWAQAYGTAKERHANDISSRYSYNSPGIAVGFDRKINASLLLGASVGYSYSNVDMKDLSERATISAYTGSLYATWKYDPWYISAVGTYGYTTYDTKRNITFGTITREADAFYHANVAGAYLEGGRKITSTFVDIIPIAALSGNSLMRDSFNERNANGLNLNADSETTSSVIGSLGVRLTKDYNSSSGVFVPELRVRWDHEFLNDRYVMNASFAGYPATQFTVRADKPDRDSMALGTGLTWRTKNGIYINLSYDGHFSADTTQHSGVLGLRYLW